MKNIISNLEFKAINENYMYDVISFLLENEIYFGVVSNIKAVEFNPELPKNIKDSFGDFSFFMISNYTFESCSVTPESLEFEAGFGTENVGSVVSTPLFAVMQIVVDDEVLALNQSASSNELIEKLVNIPEPTNSMEALLSNPENSKFIKKKK